MKWGKEHKLPELALDSLQAGDGSSNSYGQNERYTKELPEGVSLPQVYRDIIRIAWPSFVELILTQLTSMVDLIMVGKLGPWALTSVGLSVQPKFLMMALFMSMTVGSTAMVARYKGAGDPKRANTVLRQSLTLTLVLALTASLVGVLFAKPLIRFMGAADAETLAGGTAYLSIQFMGFFFLALTSAITAALRGVGDSHTAMVYNLIGNGVNVVFNYLLIYGNFGFPRMGVAGASLATVIGQIMAFILAFHAVMSGKHYLHLRFTESFRPDWRELGNIFRIGLPAMLEQFIMRAGLIIYARTVASLGTVAFATHQVCMNIQALSFMNGNAFAVSATSLMSQSLGKKRPDMAQAYSSRTQKVGMLVSSMIAIMFFFWGGHIVALYSDDPMIIEHGAQILKIIAFIQPFQSSQFIVAGALRGAGDTKATAFITFCTVFVVRSGVAVLTIKFLHWGLIGAWVAMAMDQLLRTVMVLHRFHSGKWKLHKIK